MSYFQSFMMGGFECSTHRDRNRRLDVIAMTRHDEFAECDYRRLKDIGMHTARDGVRWHLIESRPGVYDFSSLSSQIDAVKKTGIQVIWDLLHFGVPDHVDILNPEFPSRFADFGAAVCSHLRDELGPELMVCPINEISFLAWNGGEKGVFYPFTLDRGQELKQMLIAAWLLAAAQIRSSVPSVRLLAIDPAYHVVSLTDEDLVEAEAFRMLQFEAFDQLSAANAVDVIGINYYSYNQWEYPERQTVTRDDDRYRPLNQILQEYYLRYGKPLFIAETGAEADSRMEWFRYVCEETYTAIRSGVPVEGICLYPIVNHPGWADDRHCLNGLWDYPDHVGYRAVHDPLHAEILVQMARFGDVAPREEARYKARPRATEFLADLLAGIRRRFSFRFNPVANEDTPSVN